MLALALYIPTLAPLVLFSSSQEPRKALEYISTYMPSWIICLGPKICQFIKLIQCQVPTQYLVRLVRLNRFQIIVQVSHFSKEALMQDNPSSSPFLSVLQKKYAGPIPQPPSTTYQIFSNTNDIYLVRDQQNLSLLFEEEEEKKIPRRIWDCCVTNIQNWIKGILHSTFVTFFRLCTLEYIKYIQIHLLRPGSQGLKK